MDNNGKTSIRSDAGFTDRLRALTRFLFGSPYDPPLERKAFIKEALIVFCVRLPVVYFLAESMEPLLPEPFASTADAAFAMLLSILPTIFFFNLPYFFCMYRRLRGINCPFSLLVTWAAVLVCIADTVALCVFFDGSDAMFLFLSILPGIVIYLALCCISAAGRPDEERNAQSVNPQSPPA